ncbi:uncharacterized protein LOC127283547 [Leptopilina boulardi]|uniref:uncharacterized protein LOC127283547 n=2 Tax=Leptopilina boulardi TaxID=63433 RepID=UPI0021F58AFB|nr:uncharacterized protein LOC127283547 [Leptopilina boulardi]
MGEYTARHYMEMVMLYGEHGYNAHQAAAAFRQRHPALRPNHNTILRVIQRGNENGNLVPDNRNRAGAPRRARNPANEERILQYIHQHPTHSIRQMVRALQLSYWTVQQILRGDGLHAYHYRQVQALHEGDNERRMAFCRWLVAQHEQDPTFRDRILYTDEATFPRSGTFNYHNNHEWRHENPHLAIRCRHQRRMSLNVWCGVVGDLLIGPFFFDGHLNRDIYANFITNELPRLLTEAGLTQEQINRIYHQQDGAPPHRPEEVLNRIRVIFGDRIIALGAEREWPPRSPDLNVLDFHVWGQVKDYVYRVEIETIEQLRNRILDGFATITPEMLRHSTQSVIRRAMCCIEQNGGNFEQFL